MQLTHCTFQSLIICSRNTKVISNTLKYCCKWSVIYQNCHWKHSIALSIPKIESQNIAMFNVLACSFELTYSILLMESIYFSTIYLIPQSLYGCWPTLNLKSYVALLNILTPLLFWGKYHQYYHNHHQQS